MNFLKQDLYKGYISFITLKICYFELLLSSFKVKQIQIEPDTLIIEYLIISSH